MLLLDLSCPTPYMLKTLTQRFKKLKDNAIGDADRFSLESRIFHSFSLIIFIILFLETIFNFWIQLYVSCILSVGVLIIQVFLFYLSRYKNRLTLAVILSVIEVNILTAICYFYNSGLSGGTLLLFAATLFVILSISHKKYWLTWLCINLMVVLIITGYEYFDPSSIKQDYSTRAEQFIDNLASYIVTIVILYMGASTIRSSYSRQKQLADEKALALELLNAEKVKMFSIISHDLRSPLASVKQYFDLLGEIDLESKERIVLEKNLLQTIGNTQDLLTNLLKWAKNQMDGVTAHLQPLNLNEYLADTFQLFEAIAQKKDITLITITDESIVVNADVDMLQLVIRNLLNNAVKFTRAGGLIEVKSITENNNCIISITDNGTGMALGKQAEIFSLSTTSTHGTQNEYGTGLGLVLCKDYTELQGGRIWFNSTEGTGSTFYISLPLYQAATGL